MTIGFLIIFVGIQLNMVQTYTLTPRATKFWVENIDDVSFETIAPVQAVTNGYDNAMNNTPFSQASYGTSQNYAPAPYSVPAVLSGPKRIAPQDWICWPFIFIGAASVFYGLVLRR